MSVEVPGTIDEAIRALIHILDREDIIVDAYNMSEVECRVELHYTVGRYIRNNWGLLHKKGDLYWFFRAHGIWNADDMSSIIITSAWRMMHNKPIDLERQFDFIITFWMREECEME
jgi:hypothetical protein